MSSTPSQLKSVIRLAPALDATQEPRSSTRETTPPVRVSAASMPKQPPWYERLLRAASCWAPFTVRTSGPPVSPMHAAAPSLPVTVAVVAEEASTEKTPVCRFSGAHSVLLRP
ncbi:hypothetical protein SVIOM342S_05303 [Streptomyces violaceorubidus]